MHNFEKYLLSAVDVGEIESTLLMFMELLYLNSMMVP